MCSSDLRSSCSVVRSALGPFFLALDEQRLSFFKKCDVLMFSSDNCAIGDGCYLGIILTGISINSTGVDAAGNPIFEIRYLTNHLQASHCDDKIVTNRLEGQRSTCVATRYATALITAGLAELAVTHKACTIAHDAGIDNVGLSSFAEIGRAHV